MKIIELYEALAFAAEEDDVRLEAALKAIAKKKNRVRRYDKLSSPEAFKENETVVDRLEEKGVSCLPITLVNGVLKKEGAYPTNEELAAWFPEEASGCDCGSCCGCAK